MPINKNALIRYYALDKCFSNFSRNYYLDDLLEACNKELYNYSGSDTGVKRRQIFEDIKFMESPQGWNIELDRIQDGKRIFYRYFDKKYTIAKQPINELEATQLKESLMVLKRFKGMPQFEWVEELNVRLNAAFNSGGIADGIVQFETNPYLKGLSFFQELFNNIHNEKVIEIEYYSFKKSDPIIFVISPYLLKQFNSRWYLFGYNHGINDLTNIPLDRIATILDSSEKYIKNTIIDFDEYFEDIIGVSNFKDAPLERIIIEVSSDEWKYIQSKPIHGSQKMLSKNDKSVIIELDLKINNELIMLINSFGAGIKILSPQPLIERIIRQSQEKLKLYKL